MCWSLAEFAPHGMCRRFQSRRPIIWTVIPRKQSHRRMMNISLLLMAGQRYMQCSLSGMLRCRQIRSRLSLAHLPTCRQTSKRMPSLQSACQVILWQGPVMQQRTRQVWRGAHQSLESRLQRASSQWTVQILWAWALSMHEPAHWWVCRDRCPKRCTGPVALLVKASGKATYWNCRREAGA